MGPATFMEQFNDVKEDRERSIAFIKVRKDRVFINTEIYTGNENIDTLDYYTNDLALMLHLLKTKHKIKEQEL